MNRRAARPEPKLPLGIALVRNGIRQVRVFNDRAAPGHDDKVTDFVFRVVFWDQFGGYFPARRQVPPKKNKIGEIDQRIIDLKVRDGADPALFEKIQKS